MSEFELLSSTIALSMGAAWASGINLYAALLVLGVGGSTGHIALPPELQVLQDPMVIGAAGLMYFIEFFADKTPGVDSGWDGIHTFIRIPAGALLAASAVGDVTPALEITAGILGGSMSAASHAAKAGSRLMINTSPEPFTNWTASISEDIAVIAGLWAALNYPIAFIIFLVLFLIFLVWFLPKIWRGVKLLFTKLGQLLGLIDKKKPQTDSLEQIATLKALLDDGAITQEEYEAKKNHLLNLPS